MVCVTSLALFKSILVIDVLTQTFWHPAHCCVWLFSHQGFTIVTTQRSRPHTFRTAQSFPSGTAEAACLASLARTQSLWVSHVLAHMALLFNGIPQFCWSHHSYYFIIRLGVFHQYWRLSRPPAPLPAGCGSACSSPAVWWSREAAWNHVCSGTVWWGFGHGLPLHIGG